MQQVIETNDLNDLQYDLNDWQYDLNDLQYDYCIEITYEYGNFCLIIRSFCLFYVLIFIYSDADNRRQNYLTIDFNFDMVDCISY